MSLTIAQQISAINAAVTRAAPFVNSSGSAALASAQAILTTAVAAGAISSANLATLSGYLQSIQSATSDVGDVFLGQARAGVDALVNPSHGVVYDAEAVAAAVGYPNFANIGFFGDSITNDMGGPGAVTVSFKSYGWAIWANALAGWPCNIVVNAGVAGNTTTDMLERIDAYLNSYALGATTIMGGTNDIGGASPATAAEVIANLGAMYEKCKAKSVYVHAFTITPRPTIAAAQQKDLITINEWIKRYWLGSAQGEAVDSFSALVDPTSTTQAARSNMLRDNTHLTNLGAYTVGKLFAPRLSARFGAFARKLVSSVQDYYGNNTQSTNAMRPLMVDGTAGSKAGTATGNINTGWSCTSTLAGNAGAGCIGSIAARSDGYGNDQVLTCASSAAGQTFDLYQAGNLIGSPFAVGDQITMEAQITVDAGFTGLRNISIYTYSASSSGNGPNIFPANVANDVALPGTAELTLTLVSPTITIPAGMTDLGFYVHGEFNNAASAVVRVGRVTFRKQLPAY